MKQKIFIFILLSSVIFSFLLISFTKNIYIKFNEFEFVTYLLDKKREENFNILVEQDLKNKLQTPIKINLWNDLSFSETLWDLWATIIPLNKDKFSFTLSNTYDFFKNFYFSDSWYLISLDYNIIIDKNILQKKIQEKILKLDKNNFKRYFIRDYSIDLLYWLVWVEDSFPNISINSSKNKYSLVIDLESTSNQIKIKNNNFSNLILNVVTINNSDLFEEQYQSKIQNYKINIVWKTWDLNYNYLFLQTESLYDKIVTKENLFTFLNITNNTDKFFNFKDKFFDDIKKEIDNLVSTNKYMLDFYVSPLRTSDKINEKYKIIIKKITFFDTNEFILSLKSKLLNDNIFTSQSLELTTTTNVKEKFYSYKTDYTVTSSDLWYNTLICDTINWLTDWNNIRKRLIYNLQQRFNFKSQQELEEYLTKNKKELNQTLQILTTLLLEHNLLIVNTEDSSITSQSNIYDIQWITSFPFLYDYFLEKNNLIINSETDFISLCNYDLESQKMYLSILSNKKKWTKILFWPEKNKKYNKWTIEINWVVTSPIIFK